VMATKKQTNPPQQYDVTLVAPDEVEVISLDGIDVVELHPVQFEQVTEGGVVKIKAVRSYRLLRPNKQVSTITKEK